MKTSASKLAAAAAALIALYFGIEIVKLTALLP